MNKIIDSYKKLSAPLKASIFFVLCNVLQKGVSLISTPIFTRLLTAEQYGLFSVYNSYYTILSIFATFNLSWGVFIRGLTKYENDTDRFTSSLLGLSSIITIFLFIIYIIGYKCWNKLTGLSTTLMMFMFTEFIFTVAFAFWSNVQRNKYKYKALVVVTLMISLLSPLFGIIAVMMTPYKAEARIITNVMVQVFVGVFFYILITIRGKKFFVWKYWKYALLFNIPLIPHYLSMTILQQADRIMISKMVGNGEAAIYSVAYTVSTIMLLVTQAINNSFTPYTYQSIKKGKYSDIGDIAVFLLLLVGGGCILVMAFGPEVIKIFAPVEYYDAIWIIPPVAASVYFMFLYPLFGNIEFYFEKTKFTMIASCGGAIANIILNWIFIKIFGYKAAGYTTLACYILFSIGHFIAYKLIIKKESGIKKIYNVKSILLISVMVLAAMIGVLFIYKNIVIRYFIIISVICVGIIKHKYIIEKLKQIKNKQ